MAAFAWEYSARLALAGGKHDRADEEDISVALEIVNTAEVSVAAWRVHAAAWEICLYADGSRAEIERTKAQAVILQIAESLRS